MYLKDGKKGRRLMYKHLHTKVEKMQLKNGRRKKDWRQILTTSLYNIIQKLNVMKNCNQTYSAISINMNGFITSMKTKRFSICLITLNSIICLYKKYPTHHHPVCK